MIWFGVALVFGRIVLFAILSRNAPDAEPVEELDRNSHLDVDQRSVFANDADALNQKGQDASRLPGNRLVFHKYFFLLSAFRPRQGLSDCSN